MEGGIKHGSEMDDMEEEEKQTSGMIMTNTETYRRAHIETYTHTIKP